MKRTIQIILITMALLTVYTTAFAWEAPCFEGTANWQYQDDTVSVQIQKCSENGVTWFVADVQISDVAGFHTETDPSLAPVSEMATRAGAVLAINGDDYGVHKYGVIIRNGELLRTHDTTRNMLIVDANGDMSIRTDRKNEKYKELGQQLVDAGVLHTFEFGPELVRDGAAVTFSPDFDVISTKESRVEPRTAIGQIGTLHYVIIVVDGRQEGYSAGISLQGLQQLFLRYGVHIAMNLDGGGSTEMWFQGEILSSPSGGHERSVSDILWF
ncbi:MAG: phosphodiester glycosidase family protein [Eubacteriales bacterium]|nr:phosphodiester glycosidase family protein [Eubacteriales bacterium]MDD4513436.1 phosphodiester glycosidase family protein [Eubacteriales bacterium]